MGRTTLTRVWPAVVAAFIVLGVIACVRCGGGAGPGSKSVGASTSAVTTTNSDKSVAAAEAKYNAYALAHQGNPAFSGKEVRKCYVDPGLTAQSQGIAPGSVAYDCQIWVVDTPEPFFLANTWFALDADGTVLPY